jgi:hypothetical protein
VAFEDAVVSHVGAGSSRAASEASATAESEGAGSDKKAKEAEAEQVQKLKARDAEVRAHEQAHAAAGGAYAGAPSYEFQRGPDGRDYAVSGEVSIDVSEIPGDPEATIQKMQQVKRAALAPAEPSGPDQSIAASADAKILNARRELIVQEGSDASGANSGGAANVDDSGDAAESGGAAAERTVVSSGEVAQAAAFRAVSQHSAGVAAYRAAPAFEPGRVLNVVS